MDQTIDITVPDIGDFKDVQVVEILVKDGDVVTTEQALITVESDKATMEIPSPLSGTVVNVLLNVGDKVSRGSLIARATVPGSNGPEMPVKSAVRSMSPADPNSDRDSERYDVIVIGGGPGGYSAAFRAADLGRKTAIIERYATLGGVCLNVGCIPSKALLHVAAVKEEAERIADKGVRFGAPEIDLHALRSFKDRTVKRLTDGLSQMARARGVTVIEATARFITANVLEIVSAVGVARHVEFEKCIVATGSSAVQLEMFPDDDRIVTSTGALRLKAIPERMLVVGAGIIGLEMATVYSALGAKIDVVERLTELLAGVDPEAVKIWRACNAHRFERITLGASVKTVWLETDGVSVEIEGAETDIRSYDLVLKSAGRVPNSAELALEAVGVERDAKGFITVDSQMRTNVPHIFAIGDVAGGPMLAHKAVHEGHIAAEAAAGLKSSFEATIVPNVAYTDPEIAWVGIMEHEAASSGKQVKSAKFPWAASGKALVSGAAYGMTKLIFDSETNRIVGGVIVGSHAGDMIGEICLAIEMGADAIDIGKTIHPHPTLGETIGMAAEMYEGTCTDVLPTVKHR